MANYGWRELGWIPDRLNSESLPRKIFPECETPTSRVCVDSASFLWMGTGARCYNWWAVSQLL